MQPQLSHTDYSALQALITKELDGYSREFEVSHGDYIVFVKYDAEHRSVKGDSYCGLWEVVAECIRETITIDAVLNGDYDECPEVVSVLQKMFN